MADKADANERVERWTFIGKRLGSGVRPKLAYAWLDPAGEERWYAKNIAGAATHIGAIYEVTCNDNQVFISGAKAPRYIESADDDGRMAEWEAEHLAAETEQERIRQARKAAEDADSPFHAAVEVLGGEYNAIKTHGRRAAFLARVIEEVTAWRART